MTQAIVIIRVLYNISSKMVRYDGLLNPFHSLNLSRCNTPYKFLLFSPTPPLPHFLNQFVNPCSKA